MSDGEEYEVVQFSHQQRKAEDGEPVCVICGRYGEYICDATDDDVCSLQCKAAVLRRTAQQPATPVGETTPVGLVVGEHSHQEEQQGAEVDLLAPKTTNEVVRGSWRDKFLLSTDEDQRTAARVRQQYDITIENVSTKPVDTLHSMGLSDRVQANVQNLNITSPTAIQMELVPVALSGFDVLAASETGSGKTIAFLLPLAEKVLALRTSAATNDKRPLGLVLSPTRELAKQIDEVTCDVIRGLPMRTCTLIGGTPLPNQLHRIGRGCQIVIATPGRLLQCLKEHPDVLDMSCISIAVIDEVDVLLHLGFLEDTEDILSRLRSPQLIMTSATIPSRIRAFAKAKMRTPSIVTVGKIGAPAESIRQSVMWVETQQKKETLFSLLRSPATFSPPALVFVNSRIGADLLSRAITKVCKVEAKPMHGDKSQQDRDSTLREFRDGAFPVLVTSGVLGRGIHLPDVGQVIIFDMPRSVREYVHMIGRSGRMGRQGTSVAFVNQEDKALLKDLVAMLQQCNVQSLPHRLRQYQTN